MSTRFSTRPLRWDGRAPHPDDLDVVAGIYREYETALTGSVDGALDWMMLLEFTDSGEVQIVSDTHWIF